MGIERGLGVEDGAGAGRYGGEWEWRRVSGVEIRLVA